MSKPMTKFSVLLFASIVAMPSAGLAKDEGTFAISASVPEVCGLQGTSLFVDPQTREVRGSVFEYCNSRRGYQVLASHRQLAGDEQVNLRFGEESSALGRTGLSPVAFRVGPRIGRVPIIVESDNLASGIALSLSVTAL